MFLKHDKGIINLKSVNYIVKEDTPSSGFYSIIFYFSKNETATLSYRNELKRDDVYDTIISNVNILDVEE